MSCFIFLGPPASGKGTQGQRLAEKCGIPYLSTGALLRKAVIEGTELGIIADRYLSKAQYVPDEVMLPIIEEWLSNQTGSWVLDGFPRTLPQAESFDAWTKASGHQVTAIHLEVELDELLRRCAQRLECESCHWVGNEETVCAKCGAPMLPRPDDDPISFKSRHTFYQKCVLPVVTHYEKTGQFLNLPAHRSPDAVFEEMCAMIQAQPSPQSASAK